MVDVVVFFFLLKLSQKVVELLDVGSRTVSLLVKNRKRKEEEETQSIFFLKQFVKLDRWGSPRIQCYH